MRYFLINLLFLGSLLCYSCSENEVEIATSYLKIYDDQSYNATYQPVGLGALDNRTFILSERSLETTDFSGINLIVTDSLGTFESEAQLPENFVAPTKGLLKIGQTHYFLCMERSTLRPQLVSIAEDGSYSSVAINVNASYPLAANKTDNNTLVFLSYDPDGRNSIISELDVSGSILRQASYSIGPGSDVLDAIIRHFTRRSARLPFFCGQANTGEIYFNGFYNYTLSLVFTRFEDDPTGVIQGQGTDAGMKTLIPTNQDNFAFVGYQFSDHFMNANTALPTNEVSSSVNYFNRNIPEITERAICRSIRLRSGSTDYIVIASETEGRQVVLYFFDLESGALVASNYLGTLNPFTLADLTALEDGSLLISGTTFLAGRFERVYLQKLSSDEVADILR